MLICMDKCTNLSWSLSRKISKMPRKLTNYLTQKRLIRVEADLWFHCIEMKFMIVNLSHFN